EPTRVPRRGATSAIRPREKSDVCPTISHALSGGRRNRHLRPKLVQPCQGRIRHGLLYKGAVRKLPRTRPHYRRVFYERRNYPDQILARGEQRRTRAALPGSRRRSVAPVEAQSDGSALTREVVRLLPRTRPDAGGHGYEACAVVPRTVG